MKTFKEWNEVVYQPTIDGPPLDPHTISAAEVQIRTLALHIRSAFVHIPNGQWVDYRDQILKACEMMDRAANIIGDNMSGELRNMPAR